MIDRLQVENVGQIRRADIHFGDLTVLVGPQATGKSIFLQLLKLAVDAPAIQHEMRRFSIDWQGDSKNFLELYFGEGMSRLWGPASQLHVDGESRSIAEYSGSMRNRPKEERLFFIPAQRVMSMRDGLTRPFTDYRYGDPFSLREFSEKLHNLVQNEFGREPSLFPKQNRLNETLRKPINEHIFGGFRLRSDSRKLQKQIVLMPPDSEDALPFSVWSAGQREFVPLLLGLYWLMPPGKSSIRGNLRWVVIEEPEMGLHPDGIAVVMALVCELLSRGYRVCLSTHSTAVLDTVWALRFVQENGGTEQDVRNILRLPSTAASRTLAANTLTKLMKVYFFRRGLDVEDISELDPGSDRQGESEWGGLTGFSSRVGEVVASVARRAASKDVA